MGAVKLPLRGVRSIISIQQNRNFKDVIDARVE